MSDVPRLTLRGKPAAGNEKRKVAPPKGLLLRLRGLTGSNSGSQVIAQFIDPSGPHAISSGE